MSNRRVSILIVDDDCALVSVLAQEAASRGYVPVGATSVGEAEAAVDSAPVAAALVDLALGSGSGFDVIRRIKALDPDTEIIVMSGTTSMASAIQSYELAAFAFVQKPFDMEHLFATLARALERRQMNLDNRRLVWELQTINEVADGIARSLEMDDVLTGALQRTVRAFDGSGGSIRLKDGATKTFALRAVAGPPPLQRIWTEPSVIQPSDRVIATKTAVVVEDFSDIVGLEVTKGLPVRSALSVPMIGSGELLGTLTLASRAPGRFVPADQRLLAIIAGQVAVAVTNARLHDVVRRGKREWERTFDALSDAIAVFDGRGGLLRGNRALSALMKRPVTGLRGATCRDVGFCCHDCSSCAITRALAGEATQSEVTTPSGDIFSVTTFPVSGGADGAAVVQVAKNVTEEIRSARQLRQMSEDLTIANARSTTALVQLKSAQAQLLQAEKLSAIGQLVAGVAHELNNPLTSVIGYAQLLEEELRDDGEVRDATALTQDVRRIAEESERAARIVRNLLAFARRQSAERAAHDLSDLFSRVLSLRSYELRLSGVDVQTDFESGLPPVVADGSQLQQALLNLVLNAEQAMRGRALRRLRVGARFNQLAGAVELFIGDSGHGIARSNLSRIFDPFFTTRDVGEGTGLGLSICYGIVRDHGGQIVVDSKVDVGTTFTLTVPARVAEESRDDILVAHPDQGERDFLAAALRGWGYRVAAASTAAEALGRYRRGRLFAGLIDCRVLSADMPGWRAARAVEARKIPMILLSLVGEDTEGERFGREQAAAMLAPPYELRPLWGAVRVVAKELV
jgi:two-component system, NtrC family, sensor kinase